MPNRREFLQSGLAAAILLETPGFWPPSHLDVALKAERWIRTTRIPTEHGVSWPANPLRPERVTPELYNGYSGVVLFYLELFRATGDRQHLSEAVAGARQLAALLPKTAEEVRDAGLYTGIAGLGFVIGQAAMHSGDNQLATAARHSLELVKASARPAGKGVQWSDSNDIISGMAGTGLYLLRSGDREAVQVAIRAGDRLLETGEPAQGGLKWGISPRVAAKYPNFSHGAAGVGYFLARLYEVTKEQRFLTGALAAMTYLDAVANKENGGWKVFHVEPNGEDRYYLSWCHGPAGSARLFYQLDRVARQPIAAERIGQCASATIDMGVPEKQSPGYWNNISQCCGNCGVGEFFVSLSNRMPRAEYRQIVERVAANTLERATAEGDGLKWIQAENRVSPNDVIAQTGLMQGAGGVGIFFLHAHDYSKRIPLPDNPW